MLSAMVALFGKWVLVLVATACTLGSGVAFAEPFHEEPPDDATPTGPPPERWYGWQTLAVDALPAGLFVGALAAEGDEGSTFWISGSFAFAFGGPLVHVLHERPLIGLASFGLRLGLPVLGMAIGAPFFNPNPSPDMPGGPEEDPDDGILPLVVGGLAGAATASALDAGLLAYDTSPERAAKSEALGASPLDVSFGLARQGGRITVRGAF